MSASAAAVIGSLASYTQATGNPRDLALGYEANVTGAQRMWSGQVLLERVFVRVSQ
jgi:hypothetical protein